MTGYKFCIWLVSHEAEGDKYFNCMVTIYDYPSTRYLAVADSVLWWLGWLAVTTVSDLQLRLLLLLQNE